MDFDADFASVPEYARFYRSLGIQAVPAKEPREDKSWKRPALATWRDLEGGLAPDDIFEGWYGARGQHSGRSNLGIITGKASGGIFVVDLDTHKNQQAMAWWMGILEMRRTAGELETAQQTTGGGGKQLLFRAPPDWSAPTCKTPAGVDIRGEGGFAVLPPSRHESGRLYQWDAGMEPWEIGIAEAPAWLCLEIDKLVENFGGSRNLPQNLKGLGTGPVIHTASPDHSTNLFGLMVDGREDYMTRLVWARVVDERRQTPIKPGPTEVDQIAAVLFVTYSRNVKSRLSVPGASQDDLLEKEGRGISLLRQKLHAAFAQWEGKVQLHADAGPPEKPQGYESPRPIQPAAEKIRFDPETGEIFSEPAPPELEILSLPEIRRLPDPKYLVEGLVIEKSFGITFGPPGCGKTFIVKDMALSIAYGLKEWWGRKIRKTGPVIYISSEGSSDAKFRIGAWETHHQVKDDTAPFYLIRQALNFLSPDDVNKLLKAVAWVAKKEGISPVLVVVDTVSRVIPGVDENLQKDMTLFIKACDMVREAFDTTVMGVHHTSRAGNLRGSTVFDGAADVLISVEREEGESYGQITAKKIKSAADGWSQKFELRKVDAGYITPAESLVSIGVVSKQGVEAPKKQSDPLPEKAILKLILREIGAAWASGKPWSNKPQTKNEGRYAPTMLEKQWGIKEKVAMKLIDDWLYNKILAFEEVDPKRSKKGLKVIGSLD
jgi:KaiC/GvpD/RAD55 family RecA-like ATPase